MTFGRSSPAARRCRGSGQGPALALVRRHAGPVDAMASGRPARACRGAWRTTTTRIRRCSRRRGRLPRRRSADLLLVFSAVLFVYVLARARRKRGVAGHVHVQPRRRPGRAHARVLNTLRPVGGDDDRSHDRQLRLSHRAARHASGDLCARDSDRGPVMDERAPVRVEQPVVPLEHRVARGADGRCVPGGIRRAALRAARLHGRRTLGAHLPRGGGAGNWGAASAAGRSPRRHGRRARGRHGEHEAGATPSVAARRSPSSNAACAMARKA